MRHHTIEATFARGRWTFITYDGQPAPTLWRQAATRWFFHRHGHSFSVMSAGDSMPQDVASEAVNHFFKPSTVRELVDLSRFNIETRGHRIGLKK